MPSLSIVIPNYNDARDLGAAVRSCLRADDAADEVIVVDDGSTDGSLDALRAIASADARVRVLRHPINRGPAAALNTGIAAARGEWVLLRGANDLCAPGSVSLFRTLAARFPDAGVIAGDPLFFTHEPDRGVRERLGRARTPVAVTHETFLDRYGGNIIHGPFCRTAWVREAGGLDEGLRWHCDWFLFMSLGLTRGFVYAPEVLAAIRVDPESYNAAGTARADTQRAVLGRLVERLEQDATLLARMLACGCLDFFGEPLRRVLRDAPPARRARFAAVLEEPPQAVRAARRETGPESVLRAFLVRHAERLRERAGAVSVFGAGGHTRLLLEVWRELALPLPVAILDAADGADGRRLAGIPVREPQAAREVTQPLVVLSSRSYEPLLASTMRRLLPGVPFLRIWCRDEADHHV
jgi:glycosyltransferase involved in cell wall biosynthesis